MSTCPIDGPVQADSEKIPNEKLSERQPSEIENQILEGSPKRSNSSLVREALQASLASARRLENWESKGNPRRSSCSSERNGQQVSPAVPADPPGIEAQAERQTTEPLADRAKDVGGSLCLFSKNLPPAGIDDITFPRTGAIGKLEVACGNGRQTRTGPGTVATTVKLPIGQGLVIKELFAFSIQAYREVLPTIRRITKAPDRMKWEEERGRLELWGDGYAILKGELDQLFTDIEFKYLRASAVIPLCRIAKTLGACLSRFGKYATGAGSVNSNLRITDPDVELRTLLEVVLGLMPEAKDIIKLDLDDGSGSELDLSDAAEDIKEALNSLFDLVPFIEELYVTIGEPPEKEHGRARVSTVESTDELAYHMAQFYKVNIRDKFPNIDEQLAETLAEVNWSRHRRIREWAETHENQEPAEKVGSNFTDSGLGNSVFDFETPLNLIQSNPFGSNISTTSFGTNNSAMSGGIRIPKMPIPSPIGIVECCICFKMLTGINTKLLWKKHVLRDLRPYSCLFNSCSEKKTTFETRRAWVNHEFQHHRPQSEWRCSGSCMEVYRQREDFEHHILEDHLGGTVTASDIIAIVDRRKFKRENTECPFCTESIAENKCSIQLHIGTHMDEIALKALPLEDKPESNAPSEDEASTKNTHETVNNLFLQKEEESVVKVGPTAEPTPEEAVSAEPPVDQKEESDEVTSPKVDVDDIDSNEDVSPTTKIAPKLPGLGGIGGIGSRWGGFGLGLNSASGWGKWGGNSNSSTAALDTSTPVGSSVGSKKASTEELTQDPSAATKREKEKEKTAVRNGKTVEAPVETEPEPELAKDETSQPVEIPESINISLENPTPLAEPAKTEEDDLDYSTKKGRKEKKVEKEKSGKVASLTGVFEQRTTFIKKEKAIRKPKPKSTPIVEEVLAKPTPAPVVEEFPVKEPTPAPPVKEEDGDFYGPGYAKVKQRQYADTSNIKYADTSKAKYAGASKADYADAPNIGYVLTPDEPAYMAVPEEPQYAPVPEGPKYAQPKLFEYAAPTVFGFGKKGKKMTKKAGETTRKVETVPAPPPPPPAPEPIVELAPAPELQPKPKLKPDSIVEEPVADPQFESQPIVAPETVPQPELVGATKKSKGRRGGWFFQGVEADPELELAPAELPLGGVPVAGEVVEVIEAIPEPGPEFVKAETDSIEAEPELEDPPVVEVESIPVQAPASAPVRALESRRAKKDVSVWSLLATPKQKERSLPPEIRIAPDPSPSFPQDIESVGNREVEVESGVDIVEKQCKERRPSFEVDRNGSPVRVVGIRELWKMNKELEKKKGKKRPKPIPEPQTDPIVEEAELDFQFDLVTESATQSEPEPFKTAKRERKQKKGWGLFFEEADSDPETEQVVEPEPAVKGPEPEPIVEPEPKLEPVRSTKKARKKKGWFFEASESEPEPVIE